MMGNQGTRALADKIRTTNNPREALRASEQLLEQARKRAGEIHKAARADK